MEFSTVGPIHFLHLLSLIFLPHPHGSKHHPEYFSVEADHKVAMIAAECIGRYLAAYASEKLEFVTFKAPRFSCAATE